MPNQDKLFNPSADYVFQQAMELATRNGCLLQDAVADVLQAINRLNESLVAPLEGLQR